MTYARRRKKDRRGHGGHPMKVVEKRCEYCGGLAVLLSDSKKIYHGRDYGPAWYCDNNHEPAWVGCHGGSYIPMGRLANKELREAKQAVHANFDWMYKLKVSRGQKKHEARGAAYKWLAEQMGIEPKDCHIGMFSLEQCARALEILKPHQYKRRDLELEIARAHGEIGS